jgi:LuxR family maltose regulon positive regulatory protein
MSNQIQTKPDSLRLIADKMQIPIIGDSVGRPRLQEHLTKSMEQFGTTLITGRAGTGKTALAADFAQNCGRSVAWYNVESADSDWEIFQKYLGNCFNQYCQAKSADFADFSLSPGKEDVAQRTELLAGRLTAVASVQQPLLIVLDDAHCVFDSEWFAEFFQTFLPMLTPNVNLLMLSRSLPPIPLWRMRSKQMLGVIDESLLAFTPEETSEFFTKRGLSAEIAFAVCRRSYGRAAKLKQFVELFTSPEAKALFTSV